MKVVCGFCNATVSSKYILKTHLESNKTCLALRNLELQSNFNCKACNLMFKNSIKLSSHHETCIPFKILKMSDEIKTEFEKEKIELINAFKNEKQSIIDLYEKEKNDQIQNVNELQNTIKQNERIIKELQIQNDKLFESIKQAIEKPTIVTNHIKNNFSEKYFLDSLSADDIKRKCQSYLTEDVFMKGQRGIAQMCTEHIIKTRDNKALIICTDTSRKKFKYVDENGNMKEDYEARTFTDKVSKPIKDMSKILYENILSDVNYEKDNVDEEDYSRKSFLHGKKMKAIDCFAQISCFDHPDLNTEYKNELAILNK